MNAQKLIRQIPTAARVLLCAGLLAMNAQRSRADTWGTASPMPTARSALAAATSADGSKIYALGGTGFLGVLNTVESYAVPSGTWSVP